MTARDAQERASHRLMHWLHDVSDLVYWDLVQFFRYRLVVVSTMLTSLSMLLSFGLGTRGMPALDATGGSYFTFIFPGIVTVGIMFSCTFTVGYAIIMDYNRRTIEDIVLSPVSYVGFIVARLIGMILKSALQFTIVLCIAVAFFDVRIHAPLALCGAFVETALFFAGLGIAMGVYTNEISFASIANLFLIPLTYFSGVFFPLDQFGATAAAIRLLPTTVHVELMRAAVTGVTGPDQPLHQALALIYAAAMITGAMHVFKLRVTRR